MPVGTIEQLPQTLSRGTSIWCGMYRGCGLSPWWRDWPSDGKGGYPGPGL